MKKTTGKYLLLLLAILPALPALSQHSTLISGKILSDAKETIEFATVHLKGTTHGCSADGQGIYRLHAPAGEHTLVVSAVGYNTVEKNIHLENGVRSKLNITMTPQTVSLGELVVSGSHISRVKQSAYNIVAIDAKKLHNTTHDLATALSTAPGVKLRQSGGLGSDSRLSLDGFTGKHIKIFIDGVPQEGVGSSFGLSNIPVSFAERIEIYRGVVPVNFGSDALGGVINIVTGNKHRTYLDASYAYGSFNTHKSHLNFGQTLKNGITYELNAFQNYSGNNYRIETPVKNLADGQIDKTKIERVTRFHDTYHNEAIIAGIGLTGKTFADRIRLGFTFSNSDKEIQNGVRQEIVFGEKRRKNRSFMPAFEYRKTNLFTPGLTVSLTANYNRNTTHNLDTATHAYNWRGEKTYNNGKLGEQTYQDARYANDNWSGTLTAGYRLGDSHTLTLNHTLTAAARKTQSSKGIADNSAVAAAFRKKSGKNITGLAYRFNHKEQYNISLFGKYYRQNSSGPRNASTTGGFSYVAFSEKINAFGYGAAGTYFIPGNIQAKLSYEKAYRLPTTDELFGDDDLELGAIGLKPENSGNLNISLSYAKDLGKHAIYTEATFIYRDTRDYIRRTINSYSGGLYYGLYENHGRVKTKGFSLEIRYSHSNRFTVGGNFTNLNSRDNEPYVGGNTLQQSTTYKVRMPNTPYIFANGDASYRIPRFLGKNNTLTIGYNNSYIHAFPLYWENHGNKNTKQKVPAQLSHDINILCSLKDGRYNLSVECKNLTGEKLYDNFSLRKPGRSFHCKIRYTLGK